MELSNGQFITPPGLETDILIGERLGYHFVTEVIAQWRTYALSTADGLLVYQGAPSIDEAKKAMPKFSTDFVLAFSLPVMNDAFKITQLDNGLCDVILGKRNFVCAIGAVPYVMCILWELSMRDLDKLAFEEMRSR